MWSSRKMNRSFVEKTGGVRRVSADKGSRALTLLAGLLLSGALFAGVGKEALAANKNASDVNVGDTFSSGDVITDDLGFTMYLELCPTEADARNATNETEHVIADGGTYTFTGSYTVAVDNTSTFYLYGGGSSSSSSDDDDDEEHWHDDVDSQPAQAEVAANKIIADVFGLIRTGANTDIDVGNWNCLNDMMVQLIKQKSTPTTIVFNYSKRRWKVTLPAGTDLSEYQDEGGFLGLAKVMSIYPGTEILPGDPQYTDPQINYIH